MRIVFEGIWGSTIDYLIKRITEDQEVPFDRVKVSIPPPPFNGLRGWTYALTENMEIWKQQNETEEDIVLYQHSVWSSYAFASALVEESVFANDELSLFKDMCEGLSELNNLPDYIVYCHAFPKTAHQRLKREKSICSTINEHGLMETSKSLIAWLDEMKDKGVKVIEFPPPFSDDELEQWYDFANNTLKEVFNN
jgi:deoxyadenosine/deoxycytidine kinase